MVAQYWLEIIWVPDTGAVVLFYTVVRKAYRYFVCYRYLLLDVITKLYWPSNCLIHGTASSTLSSSGSTSDFAIGVQHCLA